MALPNHPTVIVSPFPTVVTGGRSGESAFESASRAVPLDLAPYVLDIEGYIESTPKPLLRHEFPSPKVVIILEFGPPISLLGGADGDGGRTFSCGMVAGIDDGPSLTRHGGYQGGVQINLSPLGARLLFQVPMVELAGEVLGLDDLLGPQGRWAHEALGNAEGWDQRFDVVEALLRARIHSADLDLGVMPWALDAVLGSGGRLDVKALSKELGYSHKHVIHLFRQHIGVTPRALARLTRFDAVIQRLKSGWTGRFTDLAYELGFYDQAHLVREVRSFGGHAPKELPGLLVGVDGWEDG